MKFKVIVLFFTLFALAVPKGAHAETIEGQISTYSRSGESGMITVKLQDGSEVKVSVDPNTSFSGGRPFSEIKVFDTAMITYSVQGNRNKAELIKVTPRVKAPQVNAAGPTHEVIRITDDDPAIIETKKRMAEDPKGTGLLRAAAKGDIAKIKQLLAEGADVNVLSGIPGMENTPLGFASSTGKLEVVKVLVESGADINKPGFAKCPPLFDAATRGHTEVVKYLIEKGADVNQKIPDELGGSILRQIKSTNHPDIVEILQAAGAKE